MEEMGKLAFETWQKSLFEQNVLVEETWDELFPESRVAWIQVAEVLFKQTHPDLSPN